MLLNTNTCLSFSYLQEKERAMMGIMTTIMKDLIRNTEGTWWKNKRCKKRERGRERGGKRRRKGGEKGLIRVLADGRDV